MPAPEVRLVSVGYEGRTAEELIDLLVAHGVEVLVDVRLNALSRKPGLSKTGLASRLGLRGIDYLHLRNLGNPRSNRDGFRANRSSPTARRYAKSLSSGHAQEELGVLAELAQKRPIALLCYEADESSCHRTVLIRELVSILGKATIQSL